jgi:hypothetical protein
LVFGLHFNSIGFPAKPDSHLIPDFVLHRYVKIRIGDVPYIAISSQVIKFAVNFITINEIIQKYRLIDLCRPERELF